MLNLGLGSIFLIILALVFVVFMAWIIKKGCKNKGEGKIPLVVFCIMFLAIIGVGISEDIAYRSKKNNLFQNLETKRVVEIDREKLLKENIDSEEVADLTIKLYESSNKPNIIMSKNEKQKIVITVGSGQDSREYVIEHYIIQKIIDAGALKFKD